MNKWKSRVSRIEMEILKSGHYSPAVETARIRRRYCLLLEALTDKEDPDDHSEFQDPEKIKRVSKIIDSIDEGSYQMPPPLPKNMDERAKEVAARLKAAWCLN